MAHKDTPSDRKTMIERTKPEKTNDRMTKTMPVGGGSSSIGDHMGKGDTRKIVGILITFTWQPQGQIFPVREGKNFIGSDKVYSDASHQDCDIQVPEDARMSGEHALILYRGSKYQLKDQVSSNGTFVNGEMQSDVDDLKNYSEIKAGSTLFTFIKVKAPEKEEPVSSPPKPDEPTKTGPDADDKTTKFIR
jgi:pSer/pThr/pTyr-binding forkhead associated (FHA) protein